MRASIAIIIAVPLLAACSATGESGPTDGQVRNPSASFGGAGGAAASGDAGADDVVLNPDSSTEDADDPCKPKLVGTLRDFTEKHIDFPPYTDDEIDIRYVPGIVKPKLGSDKKPVYNPDVNHRGHIRGGADSFAEWYRDTDNSVSIEYELEAEELSDGRRVFESELFFPLDGRGQMDSEFASDDKLHNFYFTFELHMEFEYRGGEVFEFRGDDDLWVFMNDHLVLDRGGLCWAAAPDKWVAEAGDEFCGVGTIDVDAIAEEAGMEKGGIYDFDVFHAERAAFDSILKLETSLGFSNCKPIIY